MVVVNPQNLLPSPVWLPCQIWYLHVREEQAHKRYSKYGTYSHTDFVGVWSTHQEPSSPLGGLPYKIWQLGIKQHEVPGNALPMVGSMVDYQNIFPSHKCITSPFTKFGCSRSNSARDNIGIKNLTGYSKSNHFQMNESLIIHNFFSRTEREQSR